MKRKMGYEDKELFVKQMRANLYLMDEAHEATGYILIGEERVAVIDTMMGYCLLYTSDAADDIALV